MHQQLPCLCMYIRSERLKYKNITLSFLLCSLTPSPSTASVLFCTKQDGASSVTVHVQCPALCKLTGCESLINVKKEKDAIPQVIVSNKGNSTNSCVISVNSTQVSNNGKHLPQFCCLHLHNLPGTMMIQIQTFLASTTFQQPGNSETMTQRSTYATYYQNEMLKASYTVMRRNIEESEKAGSRWESNAGHLWLEPPVLSTA